MPRTATRTSAKKQHHKKAIARNRAKAGLSTAANNKNVKTAQDLLEAADHSFYTSQDAEQAIALYTAALEKALHEPSTTATATTTRISHASEGSASLPFQHNNNNSNSNNKEHDENRDGDDHIPLTAQILEKRAEARVSMGQVDDARQDYQQALQQLESTADAISPTPPQVLERKASLWLYMGQLSGGPDALSCYRQGMALLQQRLQQDDDEIISTPQSTPDAKKAHDPARAEIRQQLASACCSAAEVYLTDCCDEPNAERECESLVQQALELTAMESGGMGYLDARQTGANLYLSQCKTELAVQHITQCFEALQMPCAALSRLVGFGSTTSSSSSAAAAAAATTATAQELTPDEAQAVQALPGFEFRTQTSKLLLECSALLRPSAASTPQADQCARAAVTVLGSLLAERDDVIEVWSLCGDAFAAVHDAALAASYYERALEMLQTVHQEYVDQDNDNDNDNDMEEDEQDEEDFQQEMDELSCQIQELQEKLRELPNEADRDEGPTPMDQE